ncbi:MAG: PQQ-binding-like beta-propeller repeat protein [Magnetococcales bacterium]|nr:PQQ-binding-like beta-propeller repeat protein [Magnetococcales bacterium]
MSRLWFSFGLMLLAGCSSMPSWMGGDSESTSSVEEALFVVPDPGRSTGLKRVWHESVAGTPDDFFNHPGHFVVDGGDVFVATHEGQVVRLHAKTGGEIWDVEVGDPIAGGVAVGEGLVYAGTVEGEMIALAQLNGKEVWRTRVSTAVASAPTVASGRVVFLTLNNWTYALSAADGEREWMHQSLPEGLVMRGAARPTVVGERVYTGYSSGEVHALSLDKGKPHWSENLTILGGRVEIDMLQDVDAAIVVEENASGDDRVFAINHKGKLVALSGDNGNRLWERSIKAVRRPLLFSGRLYVTDMEGGLSAISAEDGIPLWQTRLSDGMLTAPVYFNDQIFIADDQERLFSVDPESGHLMGLDQIGDPVHADPVVVAEGGSKGLYLWTNDGNVMRFQ